MFLTKKNAHLTSKGKNPTKKRPLGGWQDDDESPPYKQMTSNPTPQTQYQPQPQVNLLEGTNQSQVSKQIQKQSKPSYSISSKPELTYEDWDTLNDRNDIDCEKVLIENIVNAGGIRIKPTDSMLSELAKEVRGMEVAVIGSLLLSKLEVNYPFQIKGKALYIIQYLSKKDKEYQAYFKQHSDKIKSFPDPEDSVENYKKLQRTVLNQLGTQTHKVEVPQQQKPVYVDPGYHQEAPKTQINLFLEQNATKVKKNEGKKPIGPGQLKSKTFSKSSSTENKTKAGGQDNLLELSPEPAKGNVENDLLS